MKPTYTCDVCGQTHDRQLTDEEASAEEEIVFGVPHEPDDAILCDDCYKALPLVAELDHP